MFVVINFEFCVYFQNEFFEIIEEDLFISEVMLMELFKFNFLNVILFIIFLIKLFESLKLFIIAINCCYFTIWLFISCQSYFMSYSIFNYLAKVMLNSTISLDLLHSILCYLLNYWIYFCYLSVWNYFNWNHYQCSCLWYCSSYCFSLLITC